MRVWVRLYRDCRLVVVVVVDGLGVAVGCVLAAVAPQAVAAAPRRSLLLLLTHRAIASSSVVVASRRRLEAIR